MQTPRPDSKDSIYSDTYKDIYFCEEDGLAEGEHVFLKGNGLPERWMDKERFVIAETGFGTGLNFLASWLVWERTARSGQHLTYISFEKFPLTPDQIKTALGRWETDMGDKLDIMLENYPARISGWHNIRINQSITLLLIFDDVNRALPELEAKVDAWFLDGFAPAKNPEMWSETVFKAMAENSYKGTTVASFTAAGFVKRGLRDVGFHIAKTRGFGRKRDMIYGHFLPEKQKPQSKKIESVAIIGGGLAGCQLAFRLYKEKLSVDLYEEKAIASGASGNMRGLFNPRFTAMRNNISDFYASAFALVLRQFKQQKNIGFKRCGSIHLFTDADKEKRLLGSATNWGWDTNHMRVIDAQTASDTAGIELKSAGLFLPDAGFVNPQLLCNELVKDIIVLNKKVDTISREDNKWVVNGKKYDAVVIASGAGAINFEYTKSLPLSTVRGQIASASQTDKTKNLKMNICYGGYCSPAHEGIHVVGSTFQPWLSDADIREEDNADILKKFESHVPALSGEFKIDNARASLRVTTKDRFPIIGRLLDYDNIFVSLAHGSHGLISSALGAEIITEDIINGILPVPKSVANDLSPERFSKKKPL